MPTTLKEMHLETASYEDLLKVGQQATIEGETIHQMPFEVKASDIAQAIVAVDAYVQGFAGLSMDFDRLNQELPYLMVMGSSFLFSSFGSVCLKIRYKIPAGRKQKSHITSSPLLLLLEVVVLDSLTATPGLMLGDTCCKPFWTTRRLFSSFSAGFVPFLTVA